MLPDIVPLLLCGGSGTRLWPLSRKSHPKQFAQITGEDSLFQASAMRFQGAGFAAPMVITHSDFRFLVLEQLAARSIAAAATVIEPEGRNTAPAILTAALVLHARDGDAAMLVAPADHVIPDSDRFRDTVRAALPEALSGQLVTFGIFPDRAETGYGWLELTAKLEEGFAAQPQPLKSFVEKPDAATAQKLLEGGSHLWNAGIFLFTTGALIQAFKRHAPQMLDLARKAVDGAEQDLGFLRLARDPFAEMEDISIDYAVMEKADTLSVMPYGGAWTDLGGWDAVLRESKADPSGVATRGNATAIDCEASLLRSEDSRQELVGIGLKDVIAVAMPDAVLVAHKDRAQEVKQAVTALKQKGATQAEILPRDYRPWGWYESLIAAERFQVKRIHVHPGAALSLQSHHHRAEHWIVVEGTALVTVDGKETLVPENESVYVPIGAVHRMRNPGKMPLVLIEVQTGSYFGEDDIIRYEDLYAREKSGET